MRYHPVSGLPMIEENEATGEVAQFYAEIRREMGLPYIPNAAKTLATSPAALGIFCDITRSYDQRATLPQSLISMILYTIAKTGNCKYCSATNELACRTLGVDEAALETLVEDLPSFTPQRVRVIIEFALKVAHDRQNLVAADYEKVRAQGISEAELVEIILIAAIGIFNDTVADGLMIDVDEEVVAALGK
jgi:alkylhydroperoxidase family enzyme